jgi:hypothetical protein
MILFKNSITLSKNEGIIQKHDSADKTKRPRNGQNRAGCKNMHEVTMRSICDYEMYETINWLEMNNIKKNRKPVDIKKFLSWGI